MKYGLSLTLVCAIAATGCNIVIPGQVGDAPKAIKNAVGNAGAAIAGKLNAGVQKPISYKSREAKVDVMAKAFSISNNKGMSRASESFKSLATSLQSAFMASSSAMATGSSNYEVAHLARSLRSSSTQAAYAIAGVQEFKQGDATFVYDEDTRELVGLKGPDAEIRFNFVNKGNTRVWEATIVKSPDGTTGTFHIEATSSTWKPYTWPTPTAPWSCAPIPPRKTTKTPLVYPTYPPSAMPSEWASSPSPEPSPQLSDDANLLRIAQAAPDESPTPYASYDPSIAYGQPPEGEYEDYQDDDYNGGCGPDPDWVAPTPPPFKAFGNEYPEYVDKVTFKFAVKPKGDEKLALEMSGTLDDPENVPNSTVRIPTHWTYMAKIPGVYFDWESELNLIPRNGTFDAKGKMLVEVDVGEEAFTYTLSLKEAARTGTFALTNVGAKMQLLVTGNQPEYGSASVHTRLLSTTDGSEVGTVEMKPGSYNVAVVKFTDGATKEWELYPLGLIPMGPTPTTPYGGPPPTRTRI